MERSVLQLADMATPMAIRVAATLGLVDRAGPDGATGEQLAEETGVASPALRRLLDHLVTVGVLDFDASSGRFRPTDLGAQMREGAPQGVLPLLDISRAGGRAELAFVELLHSIQTNEASYSRHFGRDFWSDLDADPQLRRSFDEQMTWRFQRQAPQIAAGYDWNRFGRILDVGGGNGTLLQAILTAHPTVHGEVLDLAPSAQAATERFTAAGLDTRARAVAGSFFDPLPTGFDAYLVCDIVHDWDDIHARAILERCREAAREWATVVLIEPIRGQDTTTGIDLFMLMCFGGGDRTIDELTALAADSGLRLRSHQRVSEGRTALELSAS
jgi:2,7-dihydroxy-5-methyl-1-naphthoate 7-O-methyltransferase